MAEEADTPSADGSSNVLMLTKHVSTKFHVWNDPLPFLIQLKQRPSKGPLTGVSFMELEKTVGSKGPQQLSTSSELFTEEILQTLLL